MINTNYNSSFPDQVVPDVEKASYDYGLQVGRAIESEWFRNDRGWYDRFNTNYNNFHRLRLYARGEQSIQKYKDELSINGDLSYLNLDWKPVPVIPKFVDIVVNGMSQRTYDIKAVAQDPTSIKKRTKYAENILGDIVISFEKILSESKEQNIEVYKYLSKISIHGTLHLLGYDHIKDKDYNKMSQLEEKIINKIA